jgi:hypothetical protein
MLHIKNCRNEESHDEEREDKEVRQLEATRTISTSLKEKRLFYQMLGSHRKLISTVF